MTKYTAKYTYLTSRHAEVTRYYPVFPECREIKRMRKQWIPGPRSDFSNGPGDEASLHIGLRATISLRGKPNNRLVK